MVILRKFLFQNDKMTYILFSATITRIILLSYLCFDIKQSAYAWTEVVLPDSLPQWRGYNNPIFLFHNHISCLMFPADSRRRFSPLPVERSVRISSRSVREPITSSEDWLCIPISAVTEHCTCVNTRNGRWSSSFNGGCYYRRCYVET